MVAAADDRGDAVEIKIPPRTEYVAMVRRFVTEVVARQAGVDVQRLEDLAGRRLRGRHQRRRRPCRTPHLRTDQDLLRSGSGAGRDRRLRPWRGIRSRHGARAPRSGRSPQVGHREGHGPVAHADHVRRPFHRHEPSRDRGAAGGPHLGGLGRRPGPPGRFARRCGRPLGRADRHLRPPHTSPAGSRRWGVGGAGEPLACQSRRETSVGDSHGE